MSCKSPQANRRGPIAHCSSRVYCTQSSMETVSGRFPVISNSRLTASRPEVNIGIVCANAPILRPLYLWWRGRLQTQLPGSYPSKDRTWPSNAQRSHTLPVTDKSFDDSGTIAPTDVSAEMGLPLQNAGDTEEQRHSKYRPLGSWREDGLHHKGSAESGT